MYGRVWGVTLVGMHGLPVLVEASVGRGLPTLVLTGLPGAGVQDARERVRPAVEAARFEWPLRRVVVNLSPADLRKEGPGLDLPLALAVLAATGALPAQDLERWTFAGELSLQGNLMPTPGILAVALSAKKAGRRGVIVPAANAPEATLVDGLDIIGAATLAEVVGFLRGRGAPPVPPSVASDAVDASHLAEPLADLADVRGQGVARRALEVAAAGGHNLLLMGSPGSGKTMLARRLPSILPALSRAEALEVTQLHSVAGLLRQPHGLVRARPFRAPHHSVSPAGLLGGGSGLARPGEVSLASHGVLFLDEVAEFRRDALEGLRQPLEDGQVVITRATGSVVFPARCTLVVAANPCPCGFAGDAQHPCVCLPHRVNTYRQRLSGPLLDRIDLRLDIPRLSSSELLEEGSGESSATVAARVAAARHRQRARLEERGIACNALVPGPLARRLANLSPAAEEILGAAVRRGRLTARGFDRVLRVSRTIADLEGSDRVSGAHLAESLSYRGHMGSQDDGGGGVLDAGTRAGASAGEVA